MKIKKEKLLDKIVKKDYNNELEEILAKKQFSEDVKNLLLDIFYKVETAYNDYQKVKCNVLLKDDYIKNIMNIIKNDCDTIRFMTREEGEKSGNRTFIVNKENKEIVCYPIAKKLLYSLAKIQKSEDIIRSEDEILNRTLTNTINVGNCINTVEPFRDFNGFSWNISISEIENLSYNLVYQDLIILIGNNFLEEWTNKSECMIDYMELFKSDLESKYGKKLAKSIIEIVKRISVLLEIKQDEEFKNNLQKEKDELENKIENMKNKETYLEELSNKKKEITKKIKDIDITINNKKLLNQEYQKINENLPLEKKIFSTRLLSKKMAEERDELLNQIEEYNKLMNPKNYRKQLELLQNKFKYVSLVGVEDIDDQIFKEIILLQKDVLRCIKIKSDNAKDKTELMKVIYEMRYFNLIPVTQEKNISQIKELSKLNTSTKREILNKAHELKLINSIIQNEKLELEFFKDIFLLQIISLEDVYYKVCKEKGDYYIQFFDEDVIDEKFKLKMEEKDENNIFRSNKNSNRVKLFS